MTYPSRRIRGKINIGSWEVLQNASSLPRRRLFPNIGPLLCGDRDVALTAVDRALLQRCLNHESGAWNDFVDRFLGLIYHVIHHTSYLRSTPLRPEDTEDVAAEVLLQLVAGDYAALRQFRGQCSLATYLTV